MAASSEPPKQNPGPVVDYQATHAFSEKAMGPFADRLILLSKIEEVAEDDELRVLDLMTGSGIVVFHLQHKLRMHKANELSVIASDISDPMLLALNKCFDADRHTWSNFTTQRIDAQDTKLPDSSLTHIFCNFGPAQVPQPHTVFEECLRMLKPGGAFTFSIWQGPGWTPEVREAVAHLRSKDPNIPTWPSHEEFRTTFMPGQWHEQEYIETELEKLGFVDVKVESAQGITKFTPDEFRKVFPMSIGMVVGRMWSPEQREKYISKVYDGVAEYLNDKYGHDGTMVWDDWRALVVLGRKPK